MSKAILVIDMPEICDNCMFHYNTYDENDYFVDKCMVLKDDKYNDMTIDGYTDKYFGCPLREIPEYDYPSVNPTIENCYYAQGWNDCIDDILEK